MVADRGGQSRPVELAVADQVLDREQPAGVVADRVLGGHADAAVQLDRVETDVATGHADLQRRVRGGRGQLLGRGVLVGRDDRGPRDRAARELERDVHVRGAVVERLERVERDAELLARLEVADRGGQCRLHRTERLVGVGDAGAVEGDLERGGLVATLAQLHRGGVAERDGGGAAAVVGDGRLDRRGALDEEHAGAALGQRGRDQQQVGTLGLDHGGLHAVELAVGERDRRLRRPALAGLEPRQDRQDLAAGDGVDVLLLLLVGAERLDEAAGQHDRLDERVGGDDLAELLGGQRDLDGRGLERQAQHAHLGELVPRGEAGLGLGDLTTGLGGLVDVGDQATDGLDESLLLRIDGEVHVTVPGSCRR
ncbi:hypothetical protein GCM10009725_17390 [Aeromicrobium tamlense]